MPPPRPQAGQFGEAIARGFQPRKIVLFGSYAYGRPTEDSDVDLLVIMDRTRDRGERISVRILHAIPQLMPGGTEYTLLRLIRGLGEEEFEHRICVTRAVDAQFAAQQGMADKIFVAANGNGGAQFPLFRLARIMRTRADARARAFGMTRAQWMILIRLDAQPGISQNELASVVEVEPITVICGILGAVFVVLMGLHLARSNRMRMAQSGQQAE